MLVMALAAPFVLKGPDGRPLVSFQDIQKTDGGFGKGIEKVQSLMSGLTKSIVIADETPDDLPQDQITKAISESGAKSFQVHYWKDKNGVFHFSDEKNLNGFSELKTITNDATILEMKDKELLKKLEKIYNSDGFGDNVKSGKGLQLPDISSGSLSVKEMLSTIEKAKEVQSVVDARYEAQNKAVDAL